MKFNKRAKQYIHIMAVITGCILIKKVFKKVVFFIKDLYEYRKISCKSWHITDRIFLKELGIKGGRDFRDGLLKEKLLNKSFLNEIIKDYKIKFITCKISSEAEERKVNFADDICKHKFDLLGSGKVEVSYELVPKGVENYLYKTNILSGDELKNIKEKIKSNVSFLINNSENKNDLNDVSSINYEPIDWHVDFKSGYIWDKKTWYRKIKYGNKPGVDVKVPWELSRFQHLVALGQAYTITGDEKYSLEYIYEVIDWIENNPPQLGVNWVCTMDVAIRAANWILSLSFFKNSKFITNEFLFYFIRNIYIHGKHITNNLEYGGITSNHYISDISGLLFIGELFSEFNIGKKWERFAINELKKEMAKQIYDDGVDFEASTYYHRLALELFFYPTLFIIKKSPYFKGSNFVEIGQNIFGKKYINKLYGMFEFVLYSLKQNGKMPQLGDNDNGRLHIFFKRETLDMRYLLCLGAVFFKEPKFKVKEYGFCEEALWVFGKEGYEVWQSLRENSLINIKSRAFPDTGWYIMRNNMDYMIISCGLNGQNGIGGHAHNDKLSFELFIDGKDILVDPGTYVYTPIPYWRNKFRSTMFHNTVVVDDLEQNRFDARSLFFLKNDAKCKVNVWKSTESYDFLDAEHYGYKRLKNPVVHRRQIIYDKNECYWIVRDILTGKGEHKINWCFHIAENINFNVDGESLAVFIVDDNKKRKNIDLKIIPLDTNGTKFFENSSWVSYGYGSKVKSKMLVYSKTAATPVNFSFIITRDKFDYSKDEVLNLLERYSK
jgi:hypothetical protein